ncbi:MAG: GNAT family N-acetyltransferase [Propionibacteriales bacterium]|nr:GNAT family N-acetyltransferase [Propionibacteriales bacterium]
MECHDGRPSELPSTVLYAVLRLRVDVFVVEQECPYPELDGRDLSADCHWWWVSEGDRVLATLRLVDEPRAVDGSGSAGRIGRVATAVVARGRGLAGQLMDRAMAEGVARGHRRVVLDAQSAMADWYGRRGFVASGPEFLEDGIPHLPMVRALTDGA